MAGIGLITDSNFRVELGLRGSKGYSSIDNKVSTFNEDFNMNAVTENDLKEVKELITQLSEKMIVRFNNLTEKIDDLKANQEKMKDNFQQLKISQEKIETRLEDWKPSIDKTADLSEKIGELKNWRQIGIVLFTGLITSVFWIFKDRL